MHYSRKMQVWTMFLPVLSPPKCFYRQFCIMSFQTWIFYLSNAYDLLLPRLMPGLPTGMVCKTISSLSSSSMQSYPVHIISALLFLCQFWRYSYSNIRWKFITLNSPWLVNYLLCWHVPLSWKISKILSSCSFILLSFCFVFLTLQNIHFLKH